MTMKLLNIIIWFISFYCFLFIKKMIIIFETAIQNWNVYINIEYTPRGYNFY